MKAYTGKIVHRNDYDSFGNILTINGGDYDPGASIPEAGAFNPKHEFFFTFAYTGRQWDAETGMYYYRARYYDAHAGRFISEDPVWQTNLYAYVANNPINYTDPSGKFIQAFIAVLYVGYAITAALNQAFLVKNSLKLILTRTFLTWRYLLPSNAVWAVWYETGIKPDDIWTLAKLDMNIPASTQEQEKSAIFLFYRLMIDNRHRTEGLLQGSVRESLHEVRTFTIDERRGSCSDWQDEVYLPLSKYPLKYYEPVKDYIKIKDRAIHCFVLLKPLGNYDGYLLDPWGMGKAIIRIPNKYFKGE